MPVKNHDEYIANAAEFAKPILEHFRKLVHDNVPGVEEKIKWGMPFFDYKGPFANMASFKEHATIGFWKAPLMKDAAVLLGNQEKSMGHVGKMRSIKDMPTDRQLIKWLKEAAALNDEGIKVAKVAPTKTETPVPAELFKALKKNKEANKVWEKFPPSHRKEYSLWVADAKTDVTRDRRIEQAVEWIAGGKGRNWKYEKK